ncbi:hypothetical protein DXB24_28340 [Lachnospiraceae bacterium OM02-3]|nr:hypothetical protein DXC97_26390 [Lachnospiraceae bacterium TF09-5]RJW52645.1 hypothetical protein DXB24_28340 [Lachnospiraceae bacterium OM02-3]
METCLRRVHQTAGEGIRSRKANRPAEDTKRRAGGNCNGFNAKNGEKRMFFPVLAMNVYKL